MPYSPESTETSVNTDLLEEGDSPEVVDLELEDADSPEMVENDQLDEGDSPEVGNTDQLDEGNSLEAVEMAHAETNENDEKSNKEKSGVTAKPETAKSSSQRISRFLLFQSITRN